jgi:citrate lyase subunit beta/citryl-CoA lyase/(S)-citramalyl-CoA lyase
VTAPSLRSLLFVPGNRPDRFPRALDAGADAICIDLEDAVAPEAKAGARATVLAYSAEARSGTRRPALGVRINAIRTPDGLRDLAALADAPALPDFLMIPKMAHPAEAGIIADAFPGLPLWPIVESAAGLFQAAAIAAAPNVAGLLFGAVDYAAECGCTLAWESLLTARGTLAAARAAAGIQLLDVPALDIKDSAGLDASTRRARDLGFTGRACIHPAQVETVNAAFAPTAAEVAAAHRLVEALRAAAGGAALLDGKLIEKPVILAAERVLARAAAHG